MVITAPCQIVREWEMPQPKISLIRYHAQLGLSNNGRAIQELVVFWVLPYFNHYSLQSTRRICSSWRGENLYPKRHLAFQEVIYHSNLFSYLLKFHPNPAIIKNIFKDRECICHKQLQNYQTEILNGKVFIVCNLYEQFLRVCYEVSYIYIWFNDCLLLMDMINLVLLFIHNLKYVYVHMWYPPRINGRHQSSK